jgi:hypothetical protein
VAAGNERDKKMDAVAPPVDAEPSQAGAKKKVRHWQVTNQYGDPINENRKSRLQGASPYQAVLKAVTRFASDDGEHVMFYLRQVGKTDEGAKRAKKNLPPGTQFIRLHKYEGWKEELLSHEQSAFTSTKKIGRKPRAKSHGVDMLYITKYDAPVPVPEAPASPVAH